MKEDANESTQSIPFTDATQRDMAAALIVTAARKVERVGPTAWRMVCPCCSDPQDERPALTVQEGCVGDHDCLLFRCDHGCAAAQIMNAFGLSWPELFPHPADDVEDPDCSDGTFD
jgi:hypothetical protein